MNKTDLREELLGALIGLAKACGNNPKTPNTDRILVRGLCMTQQGENVGEDDLREMRKAVQKEKYTIVPDCATCTARCGNTDDYDMQKFWEEETEIRAVKSLILRTIQGMAFEIEGIRDIETIPEDAINYLYRALSVLSYDVEKDWLITTLIDGGEWNVACMKMRKSVLEMRA